MKNTFSRLLLEPFKAFVLLMAVLILVLQLPTAAKVGKVIAVTVGQAVGVAISDIGTFASGITDGQHATGTPTPAPTAPGKAPAVQKAPAHKTTGAVQTTIPASVVKAASS